MLVGQASFGERNRGHALLGVSGLATSIAPSVINEMDLRGSVPPGVTWEAYLSGFPRGGFYVLAKTTPDAKSLRPGMVRSRALFFSLDRLGELESLGGAISFLSSHFDDTGPYEDVDIDERDADNGSPDRGLAAALIENPNATIVWAQDSGFQEALKSLWSNLWTEARTNLTFRLAFSPADVTDHPTIVTTPSSLRSRWASFPIVKPATDELDAAAALMIGSPQGDNMRLLITALEPQIRSFAQLNQLAEVSVALETEQSFADDIGALRLICHLSPDPRKGIVEKTKLVTKCAVALTGASAGEVRMSRNLSLHAIADAKIFWDAIRAWSAKMLWDQSTSAISMIIKDTEGEVFADWKKSVNSGIHDFINVAKLDGQSLWRVVIHAPELLPSFVAQTVSKSRFDRELSAATPSAIPEAVAELILAQATGLELTLLHASVCSRMFDPANAVSRHLHDCRASIESLELTLSSASDRDYIGAAIKTKDERLVVMAAEKASSKPELLSEITIAEPVWRRLWLSTLRLNSQAFNAPKNPQKTFFELLDFSIDGLLSGESDEMLLTCLMNTRLADLNSYARRPEIWSKLSSNNRNLALSATANGWTRSFGSGDEESPELELRQVLVGSRYIDDLLERQLSHPALGCTLFRILPELSEQLFRSWIGRVIGRNRLTKDDSEAVGRIVGSRDWRRVAEDLADRCLAGKEELKPALEYCHDQLGIYRRYQLDMLGSTAISIKWRILEDLGADLYPFGPGDHGLWERAGGKDSDIPRAQTGREGWRIVVQDMENGKRKVIPRNLIEEMLKDYPKNPILQKMRWDGIFR
jgi:hypothetical protein